MENYNDANHSSNTYGYGYGYGNDNQNQFLNPNIYNNSMSNTPILPFDLDMFNQPDFTSDNFLKYIISCNKEISQLKDLLVIAWNKILQMKENFNSHKPQDLVNNGNQWIIQLDNGQYIPFANVGLIEKSFVNIHPDGSFDAVLLIFSVNGCNITRVISFEDLYNKKIEKYTLGIISDPSNKYYKKSYALNIFFTLLASTPVGNNIYIPEKQGWNIINGAFLDFTTYYNYQYCLKDYLSESIKRRIPVNVPYTYTLENFLPFYLNMIPNNWKYKLLVVMRVASILLYFFKENMILPDQFFIIEPSDNNAAKVIKSLLLTSYDVNMYIPSITDKSKIINDELNIINDGMVLFQDNTSNEERKGIFNTNLNSIKNDINGNSKDLSRHLIAIISSNPTSLSYDLPARFLTFNDVELNYDESQLYNLHCNSIGFDCILINHIMINQVGFKNELNFVIKSIENYHCNGTAKIVLASAKFLTNHRFLNDIEFNEIINWLQAEDDWTLEPADAIVNDFEKVLNKLIHSGRLKISKQDDYQIGSFSAFESDEHINFEKKVLNDLIMPLMTTTHKITKIFAAFETVSHYSGQKGMYGTNGHRRNLRIRSASTNVSVYSFSKEILDNESLSIIFTANNSDFLYPVNSIKGNDFVPILFTEKNELVAGIKINEDSDENYHMFVSGKSRCGKTYFLAQQAIFRADNGDKVIIFDHDNSFSMQTLREKVFKESAQEIEKYIIRFDVKSSGIPINLLNLDNCNNTISQRDRIKSILTAGIKIFGENQKVLLGKLLLDMLSNNETLTFTSIADKINRQNFDNKKSLQKILSVLEDIKTYNMSDSKWDNLFKMEQPIIIISTNEDSMEKSTVLIDMMLSSLYNYKVNNHDKRTSVIIDELIDHNLTKESPIHSMMRKGNKNKLHMLIATQPFPDDKSTLGKIVGYTDMKVYFRQEDDSLPIVEKKIDKTAKSVLRSLERHQLIVEGEFYNKRKKANCHAVFYGKSADYNLNKHFQNQNRIDLFKKMDSLSSEERSELMDKIFS